MVGDVGNHGDGAVNQPGGGQVFGGAERAAGHRGGEGGGVVRAVGDRQRDHLAVFHVGGGAGQFGGLGFTHGQVAITDGVQVDGGQIAAVDIQRGGFAIAGRVARLVGDVGNHGDGAVNQPGGGQVFGGAERAAGHRGGEGGGVVRAVGDRQRDHLAVFHVGGGAGQFGGLGFTHGQVAITDGVQVDGGQIAAVDIQRGGFAIAGRVTRLVGDVGNHGDGAVNQPGGGQVFGGAERAAGHRGGEGGGVVRAVGDRQRDHLAVFHVGGGAGQFGGLGFTHGQVAITDGVQVDGGQIAAVDIQRGGFAIAGRVARLVGDVGNHGDGAVNQPGGGQVFGGAERAAGHRGGEGGGVVRAVGDRQRDHLAVFHVGGGAGQFGGLGFTHGQVAITDGVQVDGGQIAAVDIQRGGFAIAGRVTRLVGDVGNHGDGAVNQPGGGQVFGGAERAAGHRGGEGGGVVRAVGDRQRDHLAVFHVGGGAGQFGGLGFTHGQVAITDGVQVDGGQIAAVDIQRGGFAIAGRVARLVGDVGNHGDGAVNQPGGGQVFGGAERAAGHRGGEGGGVVRAVGDRQRDHLAVFHVGGGAGQFGGLGFTHGQVAITDGVQVDGGQIAAVDIQRGGFAIAGRVTRLVGDVGNHGDGAVNQPGGGQVFGGAERAAGHRGGEGGGVVRAVGDRQRDHLAVFHVGGGAGQFGGLGFTHGQVAITDGVQVDGGQIAAVDIQRGGFAIAGRVARLVGDVGNHGDGAVNQPGGGQVFGGAERAAGHRGGEGGGVVRAVGDRQRDHLAVFHVGGGAGQFGGLGFTHGQVAITDGVQVDGGQIAAVDIQRGGFAIAGRVTRLVGDVGNHGDGAVNQPGGGQVFGGAERAAGHRGGEGGGVVRAVGDRQRDHLAVFHVGGGAGQFGGLGFTHGQVAITDGVQVDGGQIAAVDIQRGGFAIAGRVTRLVGDVGNHGDGAVNQPGGGQVFGGAERAAGHRGGEGGGVVRAVGDRQRDHLAVFHVGGGAGQFGGLGFTHGQVAITDGVQVDGGQIAAVDIQRGGFAIAGRVARLVGDVGNHGDGAVNQPGGGQVFGGAERAAGHRGGEGGGVVRAVGDRQRDHLAVFHVGGGAGQFGGLGFTHGQVAITDGVQVDGGQIAAVDIQRGGFAIAGRVTRLVGDVGNHGDGAVNQPGGGQVFGGAERAAGHRGGEGGGVVRAVGDRQRDHLAVFHVGGGAGQFGGLGFTHGQVAITDGVQVDGGQIAAVDIQRGGFAIAGRVARLVGDVGNHGDGAVNQPCGGQVFGGAERAAGHRGGEGGGVVRAVGDRQRDHLAVFHVGGGAGQFGGLGFTHGQVAITDGVQVDGGQIAAVDIQRGGFAIAGRVTRLVGDVGNHGDGAVNQPGGGQVFGGAERAAGHRGGEGGGVVRAVGDRQRDHLAVFHVGGGAGQFGGLGFTHGQVAITDGVQVDGGQIAAVDIQRGGFAIAGRVTRLVGDVGNHGDGAVNQPGGGQVFGGAERAAGHRGGEGGGVVRAVGDRQRDHLAVFHVGGGAGQFGGLGFTHGQVAITDGVQVDGGQIAAVDIQRGGFAIAGRVTRLVGDVGNHGDGAVNQPGGGQVFGGAERAAGHRGGEGGGVVRAVGDRQRDHLAVFHVGGGAGQFGGLGFTHGQVAITDGVQVDGGQIAAVDIQRGGFAIAGRVTRLVGDVGNHGDGAVNQPGGGQVFGGAERAAGHRGGEGGGVVRAVGDRQRDHLAVFHVGGGAGQFGGLGFTHGQVAITDGVQVDGGQIAAVDIQRGGFAIAGRVTRLVGDVGNHGDGAVNQPGGGQVFGGAERAAGHRGGEGGGVVRAVGDRQRDHLAVFHVGGGAGQFGGLGFTHGQVAITDGVQVDGGQIAAVDIQRGGFAIAGRVARLVGDVGNHGDGAVNQPGGGQVFGGAERAAGHRGGEGGGVVRAVGDRQRDHLAVFHVGGGAGQFGGLGFTHGQVAITDGVQVDGGQIAAVDIQRGGFAIAGRVTRLVGDVGNHGDGAVNQPCGGQVFGGAERAAGHRGGEGGGVVRAVGDRQRDHLAVFHVGGGAGQFGGLGFTHGQVAITDGVQVDGGQIAAVDIQRGGFAIAGRVTRLVGDVGNHGDGAVNQPGGGQVFGGAERAAGHRGGEGGGVVRAVGDRQRDHLAVFHVGGGAGQFGGLGFTHGQVAITDGVQVDGGQIAAVDIQRGGFAIAGRVTRLVGDVGNHGDGAVNQPGGGQVFGGAERAAGHRGGEGGGVVRAVGDRQRDHLAVFHVGGGAGQFGGLGFTHGQVAITDGVQVDGGQIAAVDIQRGGFAIAGRVTRLVGDVGNHGDGAVNQPGGGQVFGGAERAAGHRGGEGGGVVRAVGDRQRDHLAVFHVGGGAGQFGGLGFTHGQVAITDGVQVDGGQIAAVDIQRGGFAIAGRVARLVGDVGNHGDGAVNQPGGGQVFGGAERAAGHRGGEGGGVVRAVGDRQRDHLAVFHVGGGAGQFGGLGFTHGQVAITDGVQVDGGQIAAVDIQRGGFAIAGRVTRLVGDVGNHGDGAVNQPGGGQVFGGAERAAGHRGGEGGGVVRAVGDRQRDHLAVFHVGGGAGQFGGLGFTHGQVAITDGVQVDGGQIAAVDIQRGGFAIAGRVARLVGDVGNHGDGAVNQPGGGQVFGGAERAAGHRGGEGGGVVRAVGDRQRDHLAVFHVGGGAGQFGGLGFTHGQVAITDGVQVDGGQIAAVDIQRGGFAIAGRVTRLVGDVGNHGDGAVNQPGGGQVFGGAERAAGHRGGEGGGVVRAVGDRQRDHLAVFHVGGGAGQFGGLGFTHGQVAITDGVQVDGGQIAAVDIQRGGFAIAGRVARLVGDVGNHGDGAVNQPCGGQVFGGAERAAGHRGGEGGGVVRAVGDRQRDHLAVFHVGGGAGQFGGLGFTHGQVAITDGVQVDGGQIAAVDIQRGGFAIAGRVTRLVGDVGNHGDGAVNQPGGGQVFGGAERAAGHRGGEGGGVVRAVGDRQRDHLAVFHVGGGAGQFGGLGFTHGQVAITDGVQVDGGQIAAVDIQRGGFAIAGRVTRLVGDVGNHGDGAVNQPGGGQVFGGAERAAGHRGGEGGGVVRAVGDRQRDHLAVFHVGGGAGQFGGLGFTHGQVAITDGVQVDGGQIAAVDIQRGGFAIAGRVTRLVGDVGNHGDGAVNQPGGGQVFGGAERAAGHRGGEGGGVVRAVGDRQRDHLAVFHVGGGAGQFGGLGFTHGQVAITDGVQVDGGQIAAVDIQRGGFAIAGRVARLVGDVGNHGDGAVNQPGGGQVFGGAERAAGHRGGEGGGVVRAVGDRQRDHLAVFHVGGGAGQFGGLGFTHGQVAITDGVQVDGGQIAAVDIQRGGFAIAGRVTRLVGDVGNHGDGAVNQPCGGQVFGGAERAAGHRGGEGGGVVRAVGDRQRDHLAVFHVGGGAGQFGGLGFTHGQVAITDGVQVDGGQIAAVDIQRGGFAIAGRVARLVGDVGNHGDGAVNQPGGGQVFGGAERAAGHRGGEGGGVVRAVGDRQRDHLAVFHVGGGAGQFGGLGFTHGQVAITDGVQVDGGQIAAVDIQRGGFAIAGRVTRLVGDVGNHGDGAVNQPGGGQVFGGAERAAGHRGGEGGGVVRAVGDRQRDHLAVFHVGGGAGQFGGLGFTHGQVAITDGVQVDGGQIAAVDIQRGGFAIAGRVARLVGDVGNHGDGAVNQPGGGQVFGGAERAAGHRGGEGGGVVRAVGDRQRDHLAVFHVGGGAGQFGGLGFTHGQVAITDGVQVDGGQIAAVDIQRGGFAIAGRVTRLVGDVGNHGDGAVNQPGGGQVFGGAERAAGHRGGEGGGVVRAVGDRQRDHLAVFHVGGGAGQFGGLGFTHGQVAITDGVQVDGGQIAAVDIQRGGFAIAGRVTRLVGDVGNHGDGAVNQPGGGQVFGGAERAAGHRGGEGGGVVRAVGDRQRDHLAVFHVGGGAGQFGGLGFTHGQVAITDGVQVDGGQIAAVDIQRGGFAIAGRVTRLVGDVGNHGDGAVNQPGGGQVFGGAERAAGHRGGEGGGVVRAVGDRQRDHLAVFHVGGGAGQFGGLGFTHGQVAITDGVQVDGGQIAAVDIQRGGFAIAGRVARLVGDVGNHGDGAVNQPGGGQVFGGAERAAGHRGGEGGGVVRAVGDRQRDHLAVFHVGGGAGQFGGLGFTHGQVAITDGVQVDGGQIAAVDIQRGGFAIAGRVTRLVGDVGNHGDGAVNQPCGGQVFGGAERAAGHRGGEGGGVVRAVGDRQRDHLAVFHVGGGAGQFGGLGFTHGQVAITDGVQVDGGQIAAVDIQRGGFAIAGRVTRLVGDVGNHGDGAVNQPGGGQVFGGAERAAGHRGGEGGGVVRAVGDRQRDHLAVFHVGGGAGQFGGLGFTHGQVAITDGVQVDGGQIAAVDIQRGGFAIAGRVTRLVGDVGNHGDGAVNQPGGGQVFGGAERAAGHRGGEGGGVVRAVGDRQRDHLAVFHVGGGAGQFGGLGFTHGQVAITDGVQVDGGQIAAVDIQRGGFAIAGRVTRLVGDVGNHGDGAVNQPGGGQVFGGAERAAGHRGGEGGGVVRAVGDRQRDHLAVFHVGGGAGQFGGLGFTHGQVAITDGVQVDGGQIAAVDIQRGGFAIAGRVARLVGDVGNHGDGAVNQPGGGQVFGGAERAAGHRGGEGGGVVRAVGDRQRDHLAVFHVGGGAGQFGGLGFTHGQVAITDGVQVDGGQIAAVDIQRGGFAIAGRVTRLVGDVGNHGDGAVNQPGGGQVFGGAERAAGHRGGEGGGVVRAVGDRQRDHLAVFHVGGGAGQFGGLGFTHGQVAITDGVQVDGGGGGIDAASISRRSFIANRIGNAGVSGVVTVSQWCRDINAPVAIAIYYRIKLLAITIGIGDDHCDRTANFI